MTPEQFFREVENAEPECRRTVLAGLRSRAEVEQEVRSSSDKGGPLAGMLCLMKDNFDMAGFPTRASSTFLESVRPGPHAEGALVRKLRASGAVIAGKTHMNEFAYGLDGANAHFGDCPNPLDAARCSGGSSSGSAYAVAKGWVPLACGTDTGGSIRVPAAFCGIVGFRLPPDDWALDGVFPLAPSYDSVGWFTRTTEEMQRVTRALLDLSASTHDSLRIRSLLPDGHPLSRPVARLFPEAQTASVPKAWGSPEERVGHYNVLQSCEAYDVHREWIDTYADAYSPVVRQLILRARSWTEKQKREARAFENQFRESCADLFAETDVLLLPVSDESAPERPMRPEQRSRLLAQTTPGSLGRLPVLTLPLETGVGLLGVQCMLPSRGWESVLPNIL